MKNSIDRFELGAAFAKVLPGLFLVLFSLLAVGPAPAHAADADAANVAVDIFIEAGSKAGLPITKEEGLLVKEIVSCGVAGTPVGDCVRNAAVNVALKEAGVASPEVASMANCLLSGRPASGCAADALVKQLPREVQPMVSCAISSGGKVADCAGAAAQSALKAAGANSPELAAAANCLLSGRPAAGCAADALVKQLPPETQPMVGCMIDGGNIADCTKKLAIGMVVDKVPPELQPAAACIIQSGDAKKCAADLIVSQIVKNLPPGAAADANKIADCLGKDNMAQCAVNAAIPDNSPVKQLANCMTNPNPGKCAADFAAANLPPGTPPAAKAVVACIGEGANFAECAKQPVIAGAQNVVAAQITPAAQKAIQDALNTIDKLKPDAEMTMDAGISSGNMATLKNILGVAKGIKDKQWLEVSIAAGPELAIIAGNIILSIFLDPVLAGALAPAVAAMIHNDAAAAQLALDAIARGDAVALAQVIFTWYETQFFDKPCALLGDNDVRNTICGGLSDTVKFIADTGGDLAKKLLGMGQDVLQWLGVWDTIDDVATKTFKWVKGAVEDIGQVFGIGDGSDDDWKPPAYCASESFTPKGYFANNYLACVVKATGAANLDTSAMDSACTSALSACVAKKNRGGVAGACSAMSASLRDVANQVSAAMGTAADAYTAVGGPAMYVNEQYDAAVADKFGPASPDFCNPNFWDVNTKRSAAAKCAAFVSKQFPPLAVKAGVTPPACPFAANNNSGAQPACMASLQASLDGAAAQGQNLVGPNGLYCKQQQAWVALHPCEVVNTGKQVGDFANGNVINDIRINCQDNTPLKKLPFDPRGVSVVPLPKLTVPPSAGTRRKFPGGTPSAAIPLPSVGGKAPPNKKRIGGVIQAPKAMRDAAKGLVGPGSGGSNSAMDRLGGLMGDNAIKGVSGNSSTGAPQGGVSGRRIAHPRVSPSIPSGVRTRPSGVITSRKTPSAPASSGSPDDLVEYGGCSSCNGGGFVQPK